MVVLNLSYHTSAQPQLHRLGMPRQLGNAVPGVLTISRAHSCFGFIHFCEIGSNHGVPPSSLTIIAVKSQPARTEPIVFAVTGTDYGAPQSPPQSGKTYPQNGLLAASTSTSAMTSLSVHYELAVPSVCPAGKTAPDKSARSPNACPMHSIPRRKNSEMFGCTWFNEMKIRNSVPLGPADRDRSSHGGDRSSVPARLAQLRKV